MSEEVAASILGRIIIPIATTTIVERIKSRALKIKFKNQDISIYCTLFSRFKSSYTPEKINRLIFNSIAEYANGNKKCSYRVNENNLIVIPHFAYAQPGIEEWIVGNEYSTYPNDEPSIIIPGVSGVTTYIFVEDGNIRNVIKDSQVLLNAIDIALQEDVHVTRNGKFIYFYTTHTKSKKTLLETLTKEFKKYDEPLRDRSGDDKEIKLAYSDFALKTINKIL